MEENTNKEETAEPQITSPDPNEETAEPQITSLDPNERKLARRLRIQRRLERENQ
jgi:hypothetical protein